MPIWSRCRTSAKKSGGWSSIERLILCMICLLWAVKRHSPRLAGQIQTNPFFTMSMSGTRAQSRGETQVGPRPRSRISECARRMSLRIAARSDSASRRGTRHMSLRGRGRDELADLLGRVSQARPMWPSQHPAGELALRPAHQPGWLPVGTAQPGLSGLGR